MIRYLTLFIIVISYTLASSQTITESFYGGVNYDYSTKIIPTADGGFMMAARINNGFSYYSYFFKLDSNADTLYTRKTALPDSVNISDIVQANNGEFVVVGSGNFDSYCAMLDAYGNILNIEWFVHSPGQRNLNTAVIEIANGDFLVSGAFVPNNQTPFQVVRKLSPSFLQKWVKVFTKGLIHASLEVNPNQYVFGSEDIPYSYMPNSYIFSLDSTGILTWDKLWQDGGSITSLHVYNDTLYGTGNIPNAPSGGTVISSMNINGTIIFHKTYLGTFSQQHLRIAGTSSMLLAGSSLVPNLSSQGSFFRVGSAGDSLSLLTVGGSLREKFISIVACSDTSYIAVGITNSYGNGGDDIYIVKLNSLGQLLSRTKIGVPKSNFPGLLFAGETRELDYYYEKIKLFSQLGTIVYEVDNINSISLPSSISAGIYLYNITSASGAVNKGKVCVSKR